jgi:hypothetical protein
VLEPDRETRVRGDVGDRLEAVGAVVAVEDRHAGVPDDPQQTAPQQAVRVLLGLGELEGVRELDLLPDGLDLTADPAAPDDAEAHEEGQRRPGGADEAPARGADGARGRLVAFAGVGRLLVHQLQDVRVEGLVLLPELLGQESVAGSGESRVGQYCAHRRPPVHQAGDAGCVLRVLLDAAYIDEQLLDPGDLNLVELLGQRGRVLEEGQGPAGDEGPVDGEGEPRSERRMGDLIGVDRLGLVGGVVQPGDRDAGHRCQRQGCGQTDAGDHGRAARHESRHRTSPRTGRLADAIVSTVGNRAWYR